MQCVEKGTLNLDDPMAKYTSEIPGAGITVRHVLSHTSESTPPGEWFLYSSHFSYLTLVVESCTGLPFREALARNILHPLRMWDSVPGQDLDNVTPALARTLNPETFGRATLDRYQRVLERLATPYALNSQVHPVRAEYPDKRISAAVGLISTVRDLALFDAAIDRHLLLQPETQELAWQPTVTSRGQVLPTGLGWFSTQADGMRLVWHPGTWNGAYSALYLKVPERNLALILMANSDALSRAYSRSFDVTSAAFAAPFLSMLRNPLNLAKDSPAIAASGVVNAASFQREVAPGSWATILGQNFVWPDTPSRLWRRDEIVNGVLPASLEGVSVLVDGRPAALQFVSRGQLNVQIPSDVAPGAVSVEVSGPTGRSRSTAEIREVSPGLFTYGECRGRVYLAAVGAGGTPVAPPECVPGARPARPGEVILLYGTGFGETSPVTPSGRVVEPAPLAVPFTIRIGELEAVAEFGGIVAAGLYQFNVRVPQSPGGDQLVSIEVAGEHTQPGASIPVAEVSK
jgi:uncharacterized protein (TIGR03437 family)